jgi:DNA polymerase-3 subunit gamma/tau
MKNMNPVITTMPNVEVIVPNEIIKDEVENIRGSILSTLKLYLHNSDITLTLRVAELKERERILTRREQFEELVKQNPSVEKLREAFDLELA